MRGRRVGSRRWRCSARSRSSVSRSYNATIMRPGDIVSIDVLTYAARSIVWFIGNPFPCELVIGLSWTWCSSS